MVEHVSLGAMAFLTHETYRALGESWALNDFLFGHAMDPEPDSVQLHHLHEHARRLWAQIPTLQSSCRTSSELVERLLTLRNTTIPLWLRETAERATARNHTLYGLSCMFDQTIASVALAKHIREFSPKAMIVLGGYAVRQPTAATLMKAFPWLDAICIQEGERSIVSLAMASAGDCQIADVPGIVYAAPDGRIIETPTSDLIAWTRCLYRTSRITSPISSR